MTNKIMTTNGALLDSKTITSIRKLAQAAASLHHVEGDALGALARQVLAALPEPYEPPPPVERGCWRRKRRQQDKPERDE